MSQFNDMSFEQKVAAIFLENYDEDPLLGLKDIKQYSEPNFVGDNGKFYLSRCFVCPDAGDRGRDNYYPNRALGLCTWCGWRPNPEIVTYIHARQVLSNPPEPKRGMTIDEIKEKYPEQYEEAYEQVHGRLPEDTDSD